MEIQSRLARDREHLDVPDRELAAIASDVISVTMPDGTCRAQWAACTQCPGSALDGSTGASWCPSCGRPGTGQGGNEAYSRSTGPPRRSGTPSAERFTCLSRSAAALEHIGGLTLVRRKSRTFRRCTRCCTPPCGSLCPAASRRRRRLFPARPDGPGQAFRAPSGTALARRRSGGSRQGAPRRHRRLPLISAVTGTPLCSGRRSCRCLAKGQTNGPNLTPDAAADHELVPRHARNGHRRAGSTMDGGGQPLLLTVLSPLTGSASDAICRTSCWPTGRSSPFDVGRLRPIPADALGTYIDRQRCAGADLEA
jgi:hypothetical protein